MNINDEGRSNAAYWHERAMKAEARLAFADIEATSLLMAMVQQWPDVSPDWKPLPDVAGKITQINNMVAGLRARLAEAHASLAEGDKRYAAENARLQARLAEAERDAQRYRWLRERINWRDVDESGGAFSRDPLKYQARHWTHSDVRLPSSRPASEHIDEHIDAQLTAVSADGATP